MSPATLKTLPHITLYSEIRASVTDLITRCDIPYQKVPMDGAFLETCYREAAFRGYITEDDQSLRPFIPGGVIMSITGYAHLKDQSVRVLIALYTACGIYLDDKFKRDVDAVALFNDRFVRGVPQCDRVLEAFADLILEIPRLFPRVAANLMTTSTLNGVNALLLEYETRNMPISNMADGYATFSRVMSGASETYALFAFPNAVPVQDYLQALPEMMIFINNGNDILSFFKEEADGESVNRISILARCHDSAKVDMLQRLVDEAVNANDKILQILKPYPEAHAAYRMFSCGFVGFHAALQRYRLDELDL